jgi:ADP-ribosylglycohydrolase
LEGLSAQQIRAHYGQVADYVDGARAWKKKPYRWRLPGLYTDDTQQSLVLADVLLQHGRIESEQVAELYLRLANPKGSYLGAHRGTGRSFRLVLADLEQNVPIGQCGQTSAGCGAAMRVAPIAVYFAENPEALFDAVLAASVMTHRDIRSLAGAMAVALSVQKLLLGDKRKPSFLFRVAGDVKNAEIEMAARYGSWLLGVDDHLHSVSNAIARVEPLLQCSRERALLALVEEANRHGPVPACKRPTMGFPCASIPTCLYLLMTTENFQDAAIDMINLGGDTDTTGAILGAMAGALYGENNIPSNWIAGLQNYEGISLRADALFNRSSEGLQIPDLVETERFLSERESDCRDRLLATQQGGRGAGDCGANQRL